MVNSGIKNRVNVLITEQLEKYDFNKKKNSSGDQKA